MITYFRLLSQTFPKGLNSRLFARMHKARLQVLQTSCAPIIHQSRPARFAASGPSKPTRTAHCRRVKGLQPLTPCRVRLMQPLKRVSDRLQTSTRQYEKESNKAVPAALKRHQAGSVSRGQTDPVKVAKVLWYMAAVLPFWEACNTRNKALYLPRLRGHIRAFKVRENRKHAGRLKSDYRPFLQPWWNVHRANGNGHDRQKVCNPLNLPRFKPCKRFKYRKW